MWVNAIKKVKPETRDNLLLGQVAQLNTLLDCVALLWKSKVPIFFAEKAIFWKQNKDLILKWFQLLYLYDIVLPFE